MKTRHTALAYGLFALAIPLMSGCLGTRAPPDRIAILRMTVELSSADGRAEARRDVLTALHNASDRLSREPAGTVEIATPELAIELLVGATRQELLDALGRPAYCIWQEPPGFEGDHLPEVPCDTANARLVYRFYRLPERARGGGQELHLLFNRSGVCNASRWEGTQ